MAAISPPTDLDTLEALFKAAIEGITPTITTEQAKRWKHFKGAIGNDDHAAAATRTFRIDWGDEIEADPGEAPFTNSAYTLIAECFVATDYNLDDDTSNRVINSDLRQLRDVLEDLTDTTPGLLWVNEAKTEIDTDESGTGLLATHSFAVAYFKARS